MIFATSKPFSCLPKSDDDLKTFLNYNPVHNEYTRRQNIPERNPNETDRAGWRGYDRVYTKYFSTLRNESLNILEIGIMEGYGLLAWKRYFEHSRIFGVDINLNRRVEEEFKRIETKFPIFKDIQKYFFDSTVSEEWGVFDDDFLDIIIDDGGHHPHTQIKTLQNSWNKLKSGGLYFIEDVGHRYGEVELNALSLELEKLIRKGNQIEIYSHENHGLKRQIDSGKISADKETSHVEYIVAITKKS